MPLNERRYRSRFSRSSFTPPTPPPEAEEHEEEEQSSPVQPSRYSVMNRVREQAPRRELDVQRIIKRAIPIAIVLGIIWYLLDNFVL